MCKNFYFALCFVIFASVCATELGLTAKVEGNNNKNSANNHTAKNSTESFKETDKKIDNHIVKNNTESLIIKTDKVDKVNNVTNHTIEKVTKYINVIPLIQKRLDNYVIRKALDEFTMARKKTHVTTRYLGDVFFGDKSLRSTKKPVFYTSINVGNTDLVDVVGNNDFFNIVNNNDNEFIRVAANDGHKPNPHSHLPNNKNINKILYKYETDEETETPRGPYVHPQMFEVLKKQTELMEKLLFSLAEENRALREKAKKISDFERLMEDLEEKNNRFEDVNPDQDLNKRVPSLSTKSGTTRLSTVMGLIDENEIRRALKNDPFVRRILQLSSRKREQYLKKVKELVEKAKKKPV